MKPETLFRKRIRPILEKIPESKWFSIQQLSINGTPDIIGVVKGRFCALELKKDAKAKRDPLQEFNIDKINKAGGLGLFVYPENWQAVYEQLLDI